MGMVNGSQNKKDLNVELNLLPIFDVLSVCICFLLMTVVWIEVGAMKGAQAIGGQSKSEIKKSSELWITIDQSYNLTVAYKNFSTDKASIELKNQAGSIDWKKLSFIINETNDAQVGLILPAKNTRYDYVIRVMDLMKQYGIKDIGLSPI